ncbi:MAG: response regulator [Candidatus Omnitrophica bacterium]|nr:response regulator [Candidatus Omnitrophota bacterium]
MTQKKILIIDDDPNIVQVIKDRMEFHGYRVIGAYNGPQGLKKAEDEEPDIILLDIIMPEMHGFEVCKKLKENPKTKKIPIIMITGCGIEDIARDEPDVKAEAYIAKPFESKAVVNIIRIIIQKYSKK